MLVDKGSGLTCIRLPRKVFPFPADLVENSKMINLLNKHCRPNCSVYLINIFNVKMISLILLNCKRTIYDHN